MTDTTPAAEFRAAAFQLRNPFHLPGLKVVVDTDLVEPLADWLENTACTVDAVADKYEPDPAAHWLAPAIAVARQINGTAR